MGSERRLTDGLNEAGDGPLRRRVFDVIFLSDSGASKAFDVLLIIAILASVAVLMVETIPEVQARYGHQLKQVEWGFTLLFTAEYLARLWCVHRPGVYARSFYGLVDLAAVIPTWLELLVAGTGSFLIVRMIRILRLFRILKLSRYVHEAATLRLALRQSLQKILVFLFAVVVFVSIFGALMYFIEGPENGFRSMPVSVYWAIVTLTTVGYGDLIPVTGPGKAIASLVMVLGYGIIAVPTGIYAAELRNISVHRRRQITCKECARTDHEEDSQFCRFCGARLPTGEIYTGPLSDRKAPRIARPDADRPENGK
jgi:voltage-gated potassium channel